MDALIKNIEAGCKGHIQFLKKREDLYQVYAPIYYEDGDMVDVFIRPVKGNPAMFQLSDCCTTIMKLSYTYDINTPGKEAIFNRIILQSGVHEDDGEITVNGSIDQFFHGLMQMTGCQQKILNMRLWQRETVRSLFTQDLEQYIEEELSKYAPQKNVQPIEDYPIEVDFQLNYHGKTFYIFGIGNNDKAKTSAISLLELQKAGVNYISFVVHETLESLPLKTQIILAENADKQFPNLRHFRKNGEKSILRMAA